jgi:hypothetical protein
VFEHLTTRERRARFILFGLLIILCGMIAYYSPAALGWRLFIAVVGPFLMAWRIFGTDDIGRKRDRR